MVAHKLRFRRLLFISLQLIRPLAVQGNADSVQLRSHLSLFTALQVFRVHESLEVSVVIHP